MTGYIHSRLLDFYDYRIAKPRADRFFLENNFNPGSINNRTHVYKFSRIASARSLPPKIKIPGVRIESE